MFNMNSSNPALKNTDAFNPYAYSDGDASIAAPANVATVQGVVNKTWMFISIAVLAGAFGYWLLGQYGFSVVIISSVAGFIACFGCYMVIARKPLLASVVGPVYAVIQGIFLGALTALLELLLQNQGITVPGLALQAFVITICIMGAMLALYKARILRPTARFTAVVKVATLGCLLTYGLSFVLGMFFGIDLPIVSLSSAFQGGTYAYFGLGLNALFLIVASLGLIIDFGMVEENVKAQAPKAMEWYCAFALLVSLAWIYFEAVKLVFRLAMLFGSRD